MRFNMCSRRGIAVCIALIAGCVVAMADEQLPSTIDPRLHPDDDAFMSRQAEVLLAEIDATLERVPPQTPEPAERRLALHLLDTILHEPYAPNRPEVQEFYHSRIAAAVKDIESRTVDEGAVIWRLYNHGFVVRTASTALAFDVFRGPAGFRNNDPVKGRESIQCPGFPIAQDLVDRLAATCDVLFVSHRHADHADPAVIESFLNQGKPVVAPPDVLEGTPLHERITHLERVAHEVQKLPTQNGARELELVVYPGQQYQGSGISNNVVLVFTPEGISVSHNGDQINDPYPEYQEDFKWIDAVKDHHEVDIQITNCWTNDLLRIVRGFDPKLVLAGHENELGHPLWDRVPYWGDEGFLKLNNSEAKEQYPFLVMAWGESYTFRK